MKQVIIGLSCGLDQAEPTELGSQEPFRFRSGAASKRNTPRVVTRLGSLHTGRVEHSAVREVLLPSTEYQRLLTADPFV